MDKVKILFWKTYAKFWDLRPRIHLPKYSDYPIASVEISDNYDYKHLGNVKILFEWDEKGKHWVVFSR